MSFHNPRRSNKQNAKRIEKEVTEIKNRRKDNETLYIACADEIHSVYIW